MRLDPDSIELLVGCSVILLSRIRNCAGIFPGR